MWSVAAAKLRHVHRWADGHAGAALWWRISRHLTPADASRIDTDHTHATTRTLRLDEMLGPDRAADLSMPNQAL
jgi:hypothetical protein